MSLHSYSYVDPDIYDGITLSEYNVYHFCGDGRVYDEDKIYSFYDHGYVIVLKSKYNMFQNYSIYNNYYDNPNQVKMKSEIYDIKPNHVKFFSRAEVRIYLDSEEFEKLINQKNYMVYYPENLFSESYKDRLARKTPTEPKFDYYGYRQDPTFKTWTGKYYFFSRLSTQGLKDIKEDCHRVSDEIKKEKNRPLNRLKEFFR